MIDGWAVPFCFFVFGLRSINNSTKIVVSFFLFLLNSAAGFVSWVFYDTSASVVADFIIIRYMCFYLIFRSSQVEWMNERMDGCSLGSIWFRESCMVIANNSKPRLLPDHFLPVSFLRMQAWARERWGRSEIRGANECFHFLCFCFFLLLARGLAGYVLDFACLVNCLRIIINSLLVQCLARVFVFLFAFWLTRAEIRDDCWCCNCFASRTYRYYELLVVMVWWWWSLLSIF